MSVKPELQVPKLFPQEPREEGLRRAVGRGWEVEREGTPLPWSPASCFLSSVCLVHSTNEFIQLNESSQQPCGIDIGVMMSIEVETKAQRVEGVCPRSFSLEGVEGDLNPKATLLGLCCPPLKGPR